MLLEEGLENVFDRHKRHADATRLAVKAWGLEILAKNPIEQSDSITAIMVPDGHDSDNLRKIIYDNYDMSLGTGLNKVKGKVTSALKCPVNKYPHTEFQFIWQNAAEIAVSGILQIFVCKIAVVGATRSLYNFPLLAETSKCQNSRSNLNNTYMF